MNYLYLIGSTHEMASSCSNSFLYVFSSRLRLHTSLVRKNDTPHTHDTQHTHDTHDTRVTSCRAAGCR